jgi:hypothetical protein
MLIYQMPRGRTAKKRQIFDTPNEFYCALCALLAAFSFIPEVAFLWFSASDCGCSLSSHRVFFLSRFESLRQEIAETKPRIVKRIYIERFEKRSFNEISGKCGCLVHNSYAHGKFSGIARTMRHSP